MLYLNTRSIALNLTVNIGVKMTLKCSISGN